MAHASIAGMVAGDLRGGEQEWTADIDALAVRRGTGKFVRIDRSNVKFPPTNLNRSGPTYTTLCGTVVRIEIDRRTGALRIAKAYSVLECGKALVPEIVLGQAQGGFAMGVSYAVLESLPLYEDGPGNGQWNLGEYLIARGSDLPLRDLEVEVCRPSTPTNGRRAWRKSEMITGGRCALQRDLRRNRPSLPFLAGDAANAQRNTDVTTINVTINGRNTDRGGSRRITDERYLREYLGLTGTKFGCGAAQCLSCAVIVDSPDGTSHTSPTCIVPAVRFNGKSIRTVEGHARNGELSVAAKGLYRALRLSVRLLHRGLPQRGSGAARTVGEENARRAAISRRPSPRHWTATSAAARVTSNITKRCAA